jgi:ribosomal protein S18 acetylase RimI-like enzyme
MKPPPDIRAAQFFERWLPDHAAQLAPGGPPLTIRVRLDGEGGGDWRLQLGGPRLRVEPAAPGEADVTVVQSVADWRATLDLAPAGAQVGDLLFLNPAARPFLQLVQGTVRLDVPGYQGRTLRLEVKFGRQPFAAPDATVELAADVLAAILAHRSTPQEALLAGQVRFSGDRHLAMQLSLGLMLGARPPSASIPQAGRGRINIRLAEPADAAAIAGVDVLTSRATHAQILPSGYYEGAAADVSRAAVEWAWELRVGHWFVYVAELAGEIVGFCSGGREASGNLTEQGEMRGLFVLPEHQGTIIGRRLVSAVAAHLQGQGLSGLVLWSLADNKAAYDFYTGLGGTVRYRQEWPFGEETRPMLGFTWEDPAPLILPARFGAAPRGPVSAPDL